MSSDAIGWVIRHSPFKGVTYTVHLCIGDSANDQHDHELWMSLFTLAAKARCSRRSAFTALQELLGAGLVEELESPIREDGKPTGKPGRYRFLFPDIPVAFETRPRRKGQATTAHPTHAAIADPQATIAEGVGNHCALTTKNPSVNKTAQACPKCDDSRWVDVRPDTHAGELLPCPACNPDADPTDPRYTAEPETAGRPPFLRVVDDAPDIGRAS